MNERLECSPSLKHKLKHTICGCRHHSADYDQLSPHRDNNARLTRTSSVGGSMTAAGMWSSWSEEFLNLKHKRRSLMSRMGTTTPRANYHHRKSQSTDFRYDPLSYALNFEKDYSLDDYPYGNFSTRLPPSPPLSVVPPSRLVSDTALDSQSEPSETKND